MSLPLEWKECTTPRTCLEEEKDQNWSVNKCVCLKTAKLGFPLCIWKTQHLAGKYSKYSRRRCRPRDCALSAVRPQAHPAPPHTARCDARWAGWGPAHSDLQLHRQGWRPSTEETVSGVLTDTNVA